VEFSRAERTFNRAIQTGQKIVRAVALSSDGTGLATGGEGDEFSVKFWDVRRGKLMRTVKLGDNFVRDLRFDPTGKWLAVSYNGGRAYVLDSATGSPVLQLSATISLRFSQKGDILLSEDAFEFTKWNTSDWSKTQTVSKWNGGPVLLAFDAQRDRVAVEQEFSINITQLSTGTLIKGGVLPDTRTNPFLPLSALSPDGSFLFISLKDQLWLWDIRTDAVCRSAVMYSSGGALSPDGHWLVASKDDSIFSKERTDGVWVWDTEKLAVACRVR
jgi:WD40 repeat protein